MIDPTPYPDFAILLVDDDPAWLHSLSMTLACSAGITHVLTCHDSAEVLPLLAARAAPCPQDPEVAPIRLVLLDITMPDPDGETLHKLLAEQHPEVMVIMLSGINQAETAVRCIKRGAFDYLCKTDGHERLLKGVLQAVRTLELQNLNSAMRHMLLGRVLHHPEAFAEIVTVDPGMTAAFHYLEAVAPSSQPVLITGESGVGKELFVQALHRLSKRKGPLVPLNVAGLDDATFSDTLFGHTPGAFTGAVKARRGLIDRAAGGTLFLDEIGDLSSQAQIKLLRLLQEGEFYPVGSDLPSCLEARPVFATHQDLEAKEAAGLFRRDLYYRLHVHHVRIPPLRERPDDIPVLFGYLLGQAATEYGKTVPLVLPEVIDLLQEHAFPGNVRELRNLCFDLMSTHQGERLTPDPVRRLMTPVGLTANLEGKARPLIHEIHSSAESFFASLPHLPTLKQGMDLLVDEALRRARGNQTLAARMLGISQPAMSKRLSRKQVAPDAVTEATPEGAMGSEMK